MNRRNRQLLIDGTERLQVALPDPAVDRLVRYCDEILLWNRKMNLVRAGERDLVVRHVLDSLAVVPLLDRLRPNRPDGSLLDVGSGAGFPGVPLAIARPDAKVVLLDRSSRRCSFLTTVRLLLDLGNIRVVEGDAATYEGRHTHIACRAFAQFNRAIPMLMRLLEPGGAILYLSATNAKPDTPPEWSDINVALLRLDVPFLDAERSVLLLTDLSAGEPVDNSSRD